ncbi:MAG TPA: hypothetical protein PK059_01360 [Cyclobacteriaceae bacterium]|nr:hypothetical protein [Cyclobacteriaceae bacterium]
MGNLVSAVDDKIASFRKKYYLNLFLRGTLLSLTFVLGYFLLATMLEYNLWLGKEARFVLFLLFFGVVGYCLFRFLRQPLAFWLAGRGIGKEQSARIIGRHFPGIQDRLVNFLQLAHAQGGRTALLDASLEQKAILFSNYSFENSIDLGENRRYLRYLLIPLAVVVVLFAINQRIFTQSTSHIIHFDEEFSPQAPFSFVVENPSLIAFPNEDFVLRVRLEGGAIPEAIYLKSGAQRLKMETLKPGFFTYTFEKIQQDYLFQMEAAGFFSSPMTIRLVDRPELLSLKMKLSFPGYIHRPAETINNAGHLEIPEGTIVGWTLQAAHTQSAVIKFTSSDTPGGMQSSDNQVFNFSKGFFNPDEYSILLENENSKNKDRITYRIDVIKDQFPALIVEHMKDSVLFRSIILGGTLSDDYGLSRLELHYVLTGKDRPEERKSISLPVNPHEPQQNFFYAWKLDSLKLAAGDKLQYYLEVWDNDGVHGHKSTKSASYQFELPDAEAFRAEITRSQSSAENEIQKSLNKARSLKDAIDEAEQKLKGKQSLDWQDKKMLEDLIEQRKNLDQAVKDLQEKNRMLEEKKDAFSEQNERIREKSEQIQKLMNELLDPETKKLFEELEKMLKENQDASQIQKMLEKMDRQEINIEKELERTLELFKQLQYDYKLDQALSEIKKQREKQEALLEKTEEVAGEKKPDGKDEKGENQQKGSETTEKRETSPEELAKEQEDLKQQADELKQTLDELQKMGEKLDKPDDAPRADDAEQVKQMEEQSRQSLQEGKPKKSIPQQKQAVEKMKQMEKSLEGMQNSMEMEIDMANLESLRQIIHGLIKLSFDQESLMKDFTTVQLSDPRYVVLSQNQLKIKDDSKVLEDSLLSLSKKDAFLSSVVTREVGELNGHVDKALEKIKDRKKNEASIDMQFSMTSMNNLALMLNDHFDQMMQMMQQAKPGMGKKKGKKKSEQSLGQLQQQLNQQIEEMKNGSGKSGRRMSEDLAKMAAEQERIRRALQDMQEKLKQEGGKSLGDDIPGKMEQTEMDLVNKQITEQTIRRQKEILTRLLESEKSMREQDMDEERKGEAAKDYQKEIPRAFEEYLRLKEKEVELLKTMPPKLYPYYKKEVNEYFKRLGNHQ